VTPLDGRRGSVGIDPAGAHARATRGPSGPSEDELVDLLMTRALWSRDEAVTVAVLDPQWALGGRALRPALAALIADHDLNQPDAPATGAGRVAAIWQWISARADDVVAARRSCEAWAQHGRTGPEPADPYRDVATSMHAAHHGLPDPALLRHAHAVLTVLPELTAPDAHTSATTTQLLDQLAGLRTRALAAALM
jgi:hypothetical protein